MEKERFAYLDLLRSLAICAVVMIHTSAPFIMSYDNTTMEFIIGNIFDSVSRVGVPLFIMISGALMLKEEREFYCRRSVFRLIQLFLIWSLVYAMMYHVITPILNGENINIVELFGAIIHGHYHLWYMFAIIGLYLLTPILRSFVNLKNRNIIKYFIILSIIFQFTEPLIKLLLIEVNIFNFNEKILDIYICF